MKHYILLLLILTFNGYSQNLKPYSNWYFGNRAGVNFDLNPPISASDLNDGVAILAEGNASISDTNGNLLFYGSPTTLYDRTHQIMPNGDNLLGSGSSSQGILITPVINQSNQYYVFTTDAKENDGLDGLKYSIVDMSLAGNGTLGNPLGDIIMGEKNINLVSPVTEKLTAVMHDNNVDYWVITHRASGNDFYAFLVTCNGIDIANPVISSAGSITSAANGRGYLTASHDGKNLLQALTSLFRIEILDFDPASGIVSNARVITATLDAGYYTAVFSPNDSLIYTKKNGAGPVLQYQRYATNISATENPIGTINSIALEALQEGPDGKIYIAQNGAFALSVLETPNNLTNPGLVIDGLSLGSNQARLGLPNTFVYNYQNDTLKANFNQSCNILTASFSDNSIGNPDTWFWDFGDGDTSTVQNPEHTYSQEGIYDVMLIVNGNCQSDTVVQSISCMDTTITIPPPVIPPVIDTPPIPIIYIPNAFSPNNDAINDFFIVRGENLSNLSIRIFNRWGNKVFETDDISIAWDGTFNNKPVQEGVYLFYLESSLPESTQIIRKGNITLLR